MLSWQAAINAVNMSFINSTLRKPMGHIVYSQLARHFVEKGIGWAHATGIIRQSLPSFSGFTFGNVYARTKQRADQRVIIGQLDASSHLGPREFIEARLSRPRRYSYLGEFTYTDETTGKRVKEFKTYYSDDDLTIGEAGTFLFDSFNRERYPQFRSLEYLKVMNVEHNKDWSY